MTTLEWLAAVYVAAHFVYVVATVRHFRCGNNWYFTAMIEIHQRMRHASRRMAMDECAFTERFGAKPLDIPEDEK